MSIAILALLALVVIIAISAIRTDLNTGVLAVAFAYIVGVYFAGLNVNVVSTYLPEQLVLTLVGVTLLFGMAQHNGTLDQLAGFAIRAARGKPALLPIIFFLFTFALSAIGPGNIAAVALLAPVGMNAREPLAFDLDENDRADRNDDGPFGKLEAIGDDTHVGHLSHSLFFCPPPPFLRGRGTMRSMVVGAC